MYVTGNPVTLYVTLLIVPSSDVVTTAVVFAPLMKFTVSYGFTKSLASPLFCKFQPAFNTSDTVAALFAFTWLASVPNVGAGCAFVASVGAPFFVSGRLDFTFVIATGLVPSLSVSLRSPESVFVSLGPSLPPICTVLKDTSSFVANVILPFVSCCTSKFLPAISSTVLPALIASPFASTVLFAFLVPSVVALAFNVKEALFTALTTVSTVASLPASVSGTATVPLLVPVSTEFTVPVLTVRPLSPTVIVLSSVLTFKPASVTSKD